MAQLKAPPVRFGGLQEYIESQDPMVAALQKRKEMQQPMMQQPMMQQPMMQQPMPHEGAEFPDATAGVGAPLFYGGKPWQPSTWSLNRWTLPSWAGGGYEGAGMQDPMGYSAFSGGGSPRGSDMAAKRAALAAVMGGDSGGYDDDFDIEQGYDPEDDWSYGE